MSDGQQNPSQKEDDIIDAFPDDSHGIMVLQRVVDIIGQQNYNNKTEEPRQVNQYFNLQTYLGHTVFVNEPVYIQKCQY